ncbi:MAG: hypothetical protein ACLP8S_00040 [Solirubrobacteraceae bacterium]
MLRRGGTPKTRKDRVHCVYNVTGRPEQKIIATKDALVTTPTSDARPSR